MIPTYVPNPKDIKIIAESIDEGFMPQYKKELLYYESEELKFEPEKPSASAVIPGENDPLPDENVFEDSDTDFYALYAIKTPLGKLVGHIWLYSPVRFSGLHDPIAHTDNPNLSNLSYQELDDLGITTQQLNDEFLDMLDGQEPMNHIKNPKIQKAIDACEHELTDDNSDVLDRKDTMRSNF